MKNKEAAVTLCPKRNYQAQNHWMTEHGQGVLRDSSTLSPSSKSNSVFTSAHISAALTSPVMLLPGICQNPETTAQWARNWSQLGQPCAPWRHRDLPPACKELTIRAGQEFYIGRANPSWHRGIRSSWRRSQRAKEMRRDGCTWGLWCCRTVTCSHWAMSTRGASGMWESS